MSVNNHMTWSDPRPDANGNRIRPTENEVQNIYVNKVQRVLRVGQALEY